MTFKPHQGTGSPAARRRRCVFTRGALLAALALGAQTGCAVRYTNPRTGAEHLWGLGHLRMETEAVPDGRGAKLQRIVTRSQLQDAEMFSEEPVGVYQLDEGTGPPEGFN